MPLIKAVGGAEDFRIRLGASGLTVRNFNPDSGFSLFQKWWRSIETP